MTTTFAQLGVPSRLADALATQGITSPFPVQAATIPDGLAGRDVCGKAPTGSGKTFAFGLPILAKVEKAKRGRPRALVLAPTRELAEQIKKELAPLARNVGRHVFAVYGGVGYGGQISAMRKGVDVLVACPGRLEDLIEQGVVVLSVADLVVLDDADRMADMGFMPSVMRLLDQTSPVRQTLLFSATLDGDIAKLSKRYQTDPVRHEAASVETDELDAVHHFWLVDHHDRTQHTADLINEFGKSIVFTRTRRGADRLAKQLEKLGVRAVAMHGGRSQNQRQRALDAFSSGKARALIATDVAARGIHVDEVASVIHFDPAGDHKDYLHRSGRTARAGATGTVVTLVTHEQKRDVLKMQRDIDIDAPQETVFDYIADGSRTPEWYEAVQTASKTTEGPTAEGTRYTFLRALPQGEVVNDVEVSEFREPSVVAFTSRSGPTPFVYRYRVEPSGAGSRVILEGSITGEGLRGPAAFLAPLAGKFFKRGMAENLKALKARLES